MVVASSIFGQAEAEVRQEKGKTMEERQEDLEKKTRMTETSGDTAAVWDLEEDEDRRREAFEIYCGNKEEDLEEAEEERKKEKEKAEQLEEMRKRWQKEESERSLEEGNI